VARNGPLRDCSLVRASQARRFARHRLSHRRRSGRCHRRRHRRRRHSYCCCCHRRGRCRRPKLVADRCGSVSTHIATCRRCSRRSRGRGSPSTPPPRRHARGGRHGAADERTGHPVAAPQPPLRMAATIRTCRPPPPPAVGVAAAAASTDTATGAGTAGRGQPSALLPSSPPPLPRIHIDACDGGDGARFGDAPWRNGGSGDAATRGSDGGAAASPRGGSALPPSPTGGRADQAPQAGDLADARSTWSLTTASRTMGGGRAPRHGSVG